MHILQTIMLARSLTSRTWFDPSQPAHIPTSSAGWHMCRRSADATKYHDRAAMAVQVVDRNGYAIASGLVRTVYSEVGEDDDISLAIASTTTAKFTFSDLKTAITNSAKAWISREQLHILKNFAR